jgi:hypothetical protein
MSERRDSRRRGGEGGSETSVSSVCDTSTASRHSAAGPHVCFSKRIHQEGKPIALKRL